MWVLVVIESCGLVGTKRRVIGPFISRPAAVKYRADHWPQGYPTDMTVVALQVDAPI